MFMFVSVFMFVFVFVFMLVSVFMFVLVEPIFRRQCWSCFLGRRVVVYCPVKSLRV